MTGEFTISSLGPCEFDSSVSTGYFVNDDAGVILDPVLPLSGDKSGITLLEQAGPRHKLFFKGEDTSAAIVTCGGLCPGLNDVIRSIVMVLWYRYGVRRILGAQYGYAGLVESGGYEPIDLTPEAVEDIHQHGGTILGSSRGGQDVPDTVDWLVEHKVDVLFTITNQSIYQTGHRTDR